MDDMYLVISFDHAQPPPSQQQLQQKERQQYTATQSTEHMHDEPMGAVLKDMIDSFATKEPWSLSEAEYIALADEIQRYLDESETQR